MKRTLSTLMQEYIDSMILEQGKSESTAANYEHYLTRFINHVGDVPAERLTLDAVREFQRYLAEADRGLSRSTQNYHVIAVRSFLRYCREQDVQAVDPARIVVAKQQRQEATVLTLDELRRLFTVCDHLRDRAVLEMLFSTGLRVGELVALNRDTVRGRQFTIRGKGGKLRMVFLTERAGQWLSEYLDSREDDKPALFVSHRLDRLTTRSIQRIIKQYVELAGIDKPVTPHALRHTFATQLLANGADIRSVQEMLGHASILTTQLYTHVTNVQLRDAHDKYLNERI